MVHAVVLLAGLGSTASTQHVLEIAQAMESARMVLVNVLLVGVMMIVLWRSLTRMSVVQRVVPTTVWTRVIQHSR